MRAPVLALLFALAVAGVAGCGGPTSTGIAYFRNESSRPVNVTLDQPSGAFFGGTDHLRFQFPPWRPGWCYAFPYGMNPGSVTITVSGPSVAVPSSTTINVPTSPHLDVTVLVEASGQVHFSKGTPPPESPCTNYPYEAPAASPSS